MAKKTYTFIDLFAGLGGIRLGFEQALASKGLKGKCVFTSEIKPSALAAYNHNFPGENVTEVDITKVESKNIKKFNVLLGGFPCQAFSTAGQQKGFADTRGTLFFEIQRILKDHFKNVEGFIMENVEGLVSHDRENPTDKEGRTIKTIMNVLTEELGFNAQYVVLNAANFGVPQYRKRIYIVGCKKKYGNVDLSFAPQQEVGVGICLESGKECLNNKFSKSLLSIRKPSELYGVSLKDKRGGKNNLHSWDLQNKGKVNEDQKELLNKLLRERRKKKWASIIGIDWMDGMPLTEEQIRTFYNHPKLHSMLEDLVKKKYLYFEYPKKRITHTNDKGHVWYQRIPDKTKPKGYNLVTGKLSFEISSFLNPEKPSNTLVAMDVNTIGVIDGEGIRHLTLRECLRLFGYPDTYSLEIYEDSKKNQRLGYDLIGNSVCVPVIKSLSERLLETISK